MRTIHVEWKEEADGRAGWSVPDGAGRRRDFLFDAALIGALPRDLRDRNAVEKFQEFAQNSDFQRWWLEACGNADLAQPRILLHFPDDAWAVAWELLLGELRYGQPAHVSIIRAIETAEPPLASRFEDKLRILIVRGDSGAAFGQPELDLDAEIVGVRRAFDELSSVRANIAAPAIFDRALDALSSAVSAEKPHLIWFSGHGRRTTAGFLFKSGWAAPAAIASAIKDSGHVPAYGVFWACHTAALGKSREIGGKFPAMYEALRAVGVQSLLAMQAPVYDDNAADMAREFFLNLAAGRFIDFAAAAARARVFERTFRQDLTLDRDWACPTVWSSAVPPEDLRWNNPPARRLAQLQLAGQGAVGAFLERYDQARFSPRQYGESARTWIGLQRTWVTGSLGVENDLHWAATLEAAQQTDDRFVLVIELEGASSSEALQRWAEQLQQRLGSRDLPIADFLPALERVRANPVEGWSSFCRLPGAIVAIRNPPPADATWFWPPIDRDNSNPVIVFEPVNRPAETSPPRPGWHIERIDMASKADFAAARQAAPVLMDTLATLDMAASKAQLTAARLDPADAAKIHDVLIEIQGAFILRASAALYAREQMGLDEQVTAHERCLSILEVPGRKLTAPLRERRFSHCIGARQLEGAAQEALSLFAMYRAEERPRAAIQLLERMPAVQKTLLPSARIFVAWAYMMLGGTDQAESWLGQFPPRTPFDKAWVEGLRSEILKARADRDGALEAIGKAVAVLGQAAAKATGREQEELLRARRSYRQDHARIRQYLFRDWAAAAAEYESLLEEWRSEQDADVEVAVIMRNYQECLRSLSTQLGDANWEKARDMLEQAWERLKDYRDTAIAAEVRYEMAKFADDEQRTGDAKAYLRNAGKIAEESGYAMLHAIVEARTFWTDVGAGFGDARWREIAENLATYPDHGWPVRTLLKGRLRAARLLAEANRREDAVGELRANQATIEAHPAFREGSDRFKIAATAAGLSILAGDHAAWAVFELRDWAGDWMNAENYADAQDVWEAVG